MSYNVIRGDATQPQADDLKLIPHVCNDIGGWGSGFVVALSKRWREPEQQYRQWFKEGQVQQSGRPTPFRLGRTQYVQVQSDIIVCNMIAQSGTIKHPRDARPPIRYCALAQCMVRIANKLINGKTLGPASIHCPKFGSQLAGGNWEVIEQMIFEIWCDNDIDVTVYEFD